MLRQSNQQAYRQLSTLLLMCVVCGLLSACSPDFAAMGESRIAYARKPSSQINIVAVKDTTHGRFVKGVTLAAEQINARPGKLIGKKLNIMVEQGGSTLKDSKYLIQKTVSNPTVTAIIGHRSSKVALPASVIYEESKLVFITPFSTAKSLTGHNFKYVFRMAPNNEVMTSQLSSVASMLGYKDIVILYARDDFSRELAFLFEDAALKKKMTLVKRASFFSQEENYRSIISQFNEKKFDAIFIAAGGKASGRMASQLREMGVDVPVIGTDSLNSNQYLLAAGEASDKSFFPAIYVENEANPQGEKKAFIRAYIERYGQKPDYNAAQGYDAMMLLAEGIERANSVIPSLLSSTLHFLPSWAGVTGLHAFDLNGELLGKRYTFTVWQNGKKSALPIVHNRFLLERFQRALANNDKQTDFPAAFSKGMHEDDQRVFMLDLAQEILKFKRIGIIYEDTEAGRRLSGYSQVEILSKRKDLKILGCKIPYSLLGPEELGRELTGCYGSLSLEVDAMLMPKIPQVDRELLKFLNESLTIAGIPSIAFDKQLMGSHFAIMLSGREELKASNAGALTALLHDIKFHEFADKIVNLPEITLNLKALKDIGVDEKGILNLSPDLLINDMSAYQDDAS